MNAEALIKELSRAMRDGRLQPDDRLEKNQVGNLAVIRHGLFVAYIDLQNCKVETVTATYAR